MSGEGPEKGGRVEVLICPVREKNLHLIPCFVCVPMHRRSKTEFMLRPQLPCHLIRGGGTISPDVVGRQQAHA